MKKLFKLFILVITCVFVFSLTSCTEDLFAEKATIQVGDNYDWNELKSPEKDKVAIGFFAFNKETKTGTLYLKGSDIPAGTYELVLVEIKDDDKKEDENNKIKEYLVQCPDCKALFHTDENKIKVKEGTSKQCTFINPVTCCDHNKKQEGEIYYNIVYQLTSEDTKPYSIPNVGHGREQFYFAGWYQTSDFKNGERITTVPTVKEDKDLIISGKYLTLADTGIVAGVCMAIVFLMLILLCLIVSAFKYLPKKEEKKETVVKPQPVVSAPQKAFTMDDIKDEDMMVAALVATIDYHNETKEDVRVVSVKQIG